MTITEFKDGFDILYNNIMSGKAPGLNEFDKSFFLTKAQGEIILNHYNFKSNRLQEGIDGSMKRSVDFSNITKTDSCGLFPQNAMSNMYDNTVPFIVPEDMLIPLSFYLKETGGNKRLIVKPVSEIEFQRIISKPYKFPFRNYAYLLNNNEFQSIGKLNTYQVICNPKDLP